MKDVKGLILARLSLALCIILLTAGCTDLRNLQIAGCKVLSVSPRGFTSLDATLRLDIDNPGAQVSLRDFSALVHKDGRDIARMSSDSLTLEAACRRSYDARCTLKILDGLSIPDLGNIVREENLSSYLVDIEASVRTGRSKYRPVRLSGIPLDKIIKI